MLHTIITSETRIKLLLKFFLNSNTESYLRGLAQELKLSTNVIRGELNKLEKANLLQSQVKGNKKFYKANTDHPLYDDIHNIILKHMGIDKIIEEIAMKLGDLDSVFLTGEMALGIDSSIIDIILIGDKIDVNYLIKLVSKAESLIGRKIRYLMVNKDEVENYFKSIHSDTSPLLLWKA